MKAEPIPGLWVELCVNGQALPEYVDEDKPDGRDPTVTRFVQAVPNTQFSVDVDIEPHFPYQLDDIIVRIKMDGQMLTNAVLPPMRHQTFHHAFTGIIHNVRGQGRERLFTFGELNTSDETLDQAKGDDMKKLLSSLGKVTISLYRCKVVGQGPLRMNTPQLEPQISGCIPEKALKGRSISNRVALTNAVACEPVGGRSKCVYPYGDEPFAKFTFKYRSRKDLQIEGVLERSPAPYISEDQEEEEEELEFATMTREEAIERLRQERARKVRIKREREATVIGDDNDEEDEDGGVLITGVEPVKKRQRMSNDSGIELVDLTGD